MLKNQDAAVPEPPVSIPPVSVAQARVTPEELTAALAAIEARRQADAKTIPLDQAVSELNLDSTSDEIWAEVQKQRAKAAAAVSVPAAATAPKIDAKTRRRGWRVLVAPALVIAVLMSAGVIPHPWGHTHAPIAAPVLRPLSAVPDGAEVYADDAALTQISDRRPLSQVSVSTVAAGNRWTVFKRGGHVYLRGFTESAGSLAQITGKPLNVYNDDNSGELDGDRTSNITLRADGVPLQKSGGDEGYSSVTLPNFQPDPYTTLTPGH